MDDHISWYVYIYPFVQNWKRDRWPILVFVADSEEKAKEKQRELQVESVNRDKIDVRYRGIKHKKRRYLDVGKEFTWMMDTIQYLDGYRAEEDIRDYEG